MSAVLRSPGVRYFLIAAHDATRTLRVLGKQKLSDGGGVPKKRNSSLFLGTSGRIQVLGHGFRVIKRKEIRCRIATVPFIEDPEYRKGAAQERTPTHDSCSAISLHLKAWLNAEDCLVENDTSVKR
ncbi:hypothetical protein EVAR_21971_1 [Eumeta japonica]|uniref:Uncharacterized protein n=1 Tax=Eumeta variegata TaxID=151549 RepID=A0A4C1VU55_EUMVA|nr:hypothetical protein EVAR_21971_1 [Eumeta japonica]